MTSAAEYRYPHIILATVCLPWRPDGALDEAQLVRSVNGLIDGGLPDIYVFGTAGEGYAVDEPTFDRVTEVFAGAMRDRGREPMVGIISLSLSTVQSRIERAAAQGVRQFQISLPSWAPLSDDEVDVFFEQTCGRYPDYDFLHYNQPKSGRLLTPDHYLRLAAAHPNLVAVKHGLADFAGIQKLVADGTGIRHFFTEQTFGYGIQFGPCGFLISVASMNPARARDYFDAGVAGDFGTVRTMAGELLQVHGTLFANKGIGTHMDGAFDKVFAKILDPDFPLALKPPYFDYTQAGFEAFRSEVGRTHPEWLPAGA